MFPIIDKYIIDNYYVKTIEQIGFDLGLDHKAVGRRAKKHIDNGDIPPRPFEIYWYEYLEQLIQMAGEYRTTNIGKWAKTLLESIFEGDYEDIS